MELEHKIAAFLTKGETKPARSKLAPCGSLIRTLRQKRWTFLAIAQALENEFGLIANPKTVWASLRVRRGPIKTGGPHFSDNKPTPAKSTPPARRFNLNA